MPRLFLSCALVAAPAFASMLFSVTPAEAARCPSGQIYRPSRGICISKASAIEMGIYHARPGRHRSAVAKNSPPPEVSPPEPSPPEPVRTRATARRDAQPVPGRAPKPVVAAERSREPVRPQSAEARAPEPGEPTIAPADLARRAERLAYASAPSFAFPPPARTRTLMSPRPVVAETFSTSTLRPDSSPYGGLVALEPLF